MALSGVDERGDHGCAECPSREAALQLELPGVELGAPAPARRRVRRRCRRRRARSRRARGRARAHVAGQADRVARRTSGRDGAAAPRSGGRPPRSRVVGRRCPRATLGAERYGMNPARSRSGSADGAGWRPMRRLRNDEGPCVRRRTGLHRVDVPSLTGASMRRLRPGPGGLIRDLRTFLCVTSTVATFGRPSTPFRGSS